MNEAGASQTSGRRAGDFARAAQDAGEMAQALATLAGAGEGATEAQRHCRATAERVLRDGDGEEWYRVWVASADALRRASSGCLMQSHVRNIKAENCHPAGVRFLGASLCYAVASWFLDAPERDPRCALAEASSLTCLQMGAKLLLPALPATDSDKGLALWLQPEREKAGAPVLGLIGSATAVERCALLAPDALAAGWRCWVPWQAAGKNLPEGVEPSALLRLDRNEDREWVRARLFAIVGATGYTARDKQK